MRGISANLAQHMGRIAALSSASLQPALLLEESQHLLQQKVFGLPFYETGAEFGEHRSIKPGIGEFQAEKVLDLDPSTHRICRLPIGQVLDKLQHDDQS